MENLIIIGSGPAGLTAAIYAARADLNPLLIAGYQSGGQLMLTTEVENFPGFEDGIMGPDLMLKMRKQAERFGTRFIDKDVTKLDLTDARVKKIFVEDEILEAKSVIIATGASAKWLDVPGEQKLRGRGVSSCATCDGAFFKDKIIAVIGGGDSAMEEANFLTRFASKLYLIHRRDEFRASEIMQKRVKSNPKIEIIWNTTIEEIIGENKVEKLKLKNLETETLSELAVDGVFVAIGHSPNTLFLDGQLPLNEKGHIKTQEGSETLTAIPGVFVAGDIYDYKYRQAITAAGSGCKAALDAEKYLEL